MSDWLREEICPIETTLAVNVGRMYDTPTDRFGYTRIYVDMLSPNSLYYAQSIVGRFT